MKFQQFIKQGYLILKQDFLKTLVESSELDIFNRNIVSFHSAMRSFFERPEQERKFFESGDYVFRSSGYRAGYWPQGIYKDIYEDKKFPIEYYLSRSLYSSDRDSFLVPENNWNSESLPEIEKLPHNRGYDLALFIDSHIISPLVEELKNYLQANSRLDYIFDIASVYYRDKAMLNIHRDKAFIQSIVGPASGLMIQPDGATKPQEVLLDTGEILVYTGFQFQEYVKRFGDIMKVKPLRHGVISDEDKRMSIVVAITINLRMKHFFG